MKILFLSFSLITMLFLGGCAQTDSTIALGNSNLPWGRPTDWEKSMPIAPGIVY